MKKILASILVLTMLVCCLSISAFAVEDPATFTMENATVTAGETVQIPVNISVKKELAAVLCTLTIDERLEGAAITRMVGSQWSLDNLGSVMPGALGGMTGKADYYGAYNVDFPEGVVVTYTIKVPADAINGEYTLTLFCDDFAYVEAGNEGGEGGRENTTTYEGATAEVKATLTVVGGKDAPAHEHAAVGGWKNDANGHWNVCECGEEINKGDHVYTDDADKTCDTCGYERHVHEAGSKWENDADGHWNECSCGEEINKGDHVYADDADKTCDICGYERHLHVAGTAYGMDANNHWNTCECGEKVNVEAHVYADDADKTCDTCGYERHLHTAGTEFGSDKDNHWNTCECGEKVNVEAHVYADDEDTTCDTCGYERTIGEDKEDEKDEDKKDDTTDTGDSTNLYIYMALCLFAAAAIVVTSYELKKTRG